MNRDRMKRSLMLLSVLMGLNGLVLQGYAEAVLFSDPAYQFDGTSAIKADRDGNLWVTNFNGGTVTEIKKDPAGGYSPEVFSYSDFNEPDQISIDNSGNVWVTNGYTRGYGPTVVKLKHQSDGSYSLVVFSGKKYGLSDLAAISTDSKGNIWTATDGVTEFKKNALGKYGMVFFLASQYGFNDPEGIDVDSDDNIANPIKLSERQRLLLLERFQLI